MTVRAKEDVVTVRATFRRQSENGDAVAYVEQRKGEGPFVSHMLYLRKSALPDPPPETVTVTVDLTAARVSLVQPTSRATPPTRSVVPTLVRPVVKPGDRVTVVKDRTSGVRDPRELIHQYLGRTGVVLRVTGEGAIIELGGEGVWFSYDELEKKD
jgi:hypothetical protein